MRFKLPITVREFKVRAAVLQVWIWAWTWGMQHDTQSWS